MKKLGLAPLVIALAILVGTTASRSQATDPPASTSSTPEPITGTPSTPNPGSETVDKKDPFQPYSIGDPSSGWSYQSLNADEKRVVDHGLAEDYSAINATYAGPSKALSDRAKAEAAAAQLGADNLDTTGVTP